MKNIIICGAGRVGHAIARHLEREDMSVVVIDTDEKRLDRVATELKVSDTIPGNACDRNILEQAGADDCDIIVAVTRSDETNFTICQLASKQFEIQSKIARMRGAHYTQLIEKGDSKMFDGVVDVVIQPEIDVAKVIVRNFEMPETKFYCELADEQLKIIALKLSREEEFPHEKLKPYDPYPNQENNSYNNKSDGSDDKNQFDEQENDNGNNKENEKESPGIAILGFIDHDEDELEFLKLSELSRYKDKESDQIRYTPKDYTVYFTVKSSAFEHFMTEFVGEGDDISRVLIVGGGHIGYNVAKELEKRKRVHTRLIEQDSNVANWAAERLKKTSVLLGDGLDRKMLNEAKVSDADCVFAMTGDDKTNIMICLFAEHLKAKHSVAMINDRNLKSFSESTDIDTVVSLRLQTLSKVIDFIRGKNIHNTRVIEDGKAEILEGIVSDDSLMKDEEINNEYVGKNIQLVAVIRPNENAESNTESPDQIYLPNDSLPKQYEQGDRVIMLCLHNKETVKNVERKFSVSATT